MNTNSNRAASLHSRQKYKQKHGGLSRFLCCSRAPLDEFEGNDTDSEVAKYHGGHAPVRVYVRTAGDSQAGGSLSSSSSEADGTPQQPPDSTERLERADSDASSTASSAWLDCMEDWGPAASDASSDGSMELQQTEQDHYASLPSELATILKKYRQGCTMGCKPAAALIKYMETTGTALQQLQHMLAPLLEAEQAAGGQALPAATPSMSALERTLSLRCPASERGSASQAQEQQQQQQHSLSRLLSNVELVQQTLAGMHRLDGFKQVASGPLELWYMHDTTNQLQVIRARTVLDEPVVHGLCLAREVDLVTSWNPAIADMRELASYSPAELLVYILLWVPWPLPAPEVVNYALGVDLLDSQEEAVLIATRGREEDLPAGVVLPQHPRSQRLRMDAGGFMFKPLPPHPDRPDVPRMEATVLVSIDGSHWTVPDAIISFVLKVFAPLVYKSVLKVLQKMFHTANSGAAPRSSSSSSRGASSAGGEAVCGNELLDRLASRPEYAAIGAHVERHLAAAAAAKQQPAHSTS